MATTNDNDAEQKWLASIPKSPGIPADLVAMSREQCLARITQLFEEHPNIQMFECGRTDPYVSDNDLRSMIWDIEYCLGVRAA